MNKNRNESDNTNILEFSTQQNDPVVQRHNRRMQKNAKKRYIKYILLCFSVIIIIAAFFAINSGKDNFKNTDEVNRTAIDTLSSENYAFSAYREGYIYAKDGKISCYNTNQEMQWEINGSKTEPKIAVNEEYALIYYPNDALAVVTDGSKTKSIKTDGNVVYGTVNKNGYAALIVEEDGFKNQIAVYNASGKSLYKWHNSDEYITAVQFSDNNKYLVASGVGFDEKKVGAEAFVFDITTKDSAKKVALGDSVICDMKFISKNDFIVILDNKTVCYNIGQKEKWSIDYDGKNLCTYDISDIGSVALVFGDDSAMSGSEIMFYNRRGTLKGKCKTDSKVSQINMQGSTALAICDRELAVLNSKGKKIYSQELNYDVRKSYFLGDKKTALTIAGSGAYLVSAH